MFFYKKILHRKCIQMIAAVRITTQRKCRWYKIIFTIANRILIATRKKRK